MRSIGFGVLIVVCLSCASTASAALITETFTVTGFDFVGIFHPETPAPVASGTISFTLTFDPTLTYNNATSGLTINSTFLTNISSGFTYNPTALNGILLVGGLVGNVNGESINSNDFSIRLFNVSTTPTFDSFQYGKSSYGDVASTTSGSVVAVIPEPATLGVFALASLLVRRRRRMGQ